MKSIIYFFMLVTLPISSFAKDPDRKAPADYDKKLNFSLDNINDSPFFFASRGYFENSREYPFSSPYISKKGEFKFLKDEGYRPDKIETDEKTGTVSYSMDDLNYIVTKHANGKLKTVHSSVKYSGREMDTFSEFDENGKFIERTSCSKSPAKISISWYPEADGRRHCRVINEHICRNIKKYKSWFEGKGRECIKQVERFRNFYESSIQGSLEDSLPSMNFKFDENIHRPDRVASVINEMDVAIRECDKYVKQDILTLIDFDKDNNATPEKEHNSDSQDSE
jgi:hypothetical protein